MGWLALWLAAAPLFAQADPANLIESGRFSATLEPEADAELYSAYTLKFPSAVKSRFEANNTVWGHLYLPKIAKSSPPPCVLVLPVMAAPNVYIEMQFIRAFLKRGQAVLWLEGPYQFHRVPRPLAPSGQVFLARTAKGLAGNYRQAVLDARRALRWLEGSGKVDPKRIAIFGVSLGSLVGATVLSLDERLTGGVFLLGGADFPSIVFGSSMTRKFMLQSGITPEELRREWKGIDPLDYRDRNKDRRVLLINAKWDAVIPKKNALALKDAFPAARQMWVPLGHYSSIVHLIWLPRYVAGQMEAIIR